MFRIEIFSMRQGAVKPPKDFTQIKCDRSSPLGNPFYPADDSLAERDRVCDEFNSWFPKNYNKGNKAQEFNRIIKIARKANVALMCWCAPKRCHCITIKRILDKKLNRTNTLF